MNDNDFLTVREIEELLTKIATSKDPKERKTKKFFTMNKVIVVILLTVFLFAAVVIFCNINGVYVQDSLVQMFLSIMAAELVTMGGIKITDKVKGGQDLTHQPEDNCG